jgi:hypothetical protein
VHNNYHSLYVEQTRKYNLCFLDWNQSLYQCTQICCLIRPTSACLVFKNENVFQLCPSLFISANGFQSCPGIMSTYSRVILILLLLKKRYEDMGEWRYSSTFIDLGTRWRWVVSFTPLQLYPWRRSLWYPLDRRQGGPQSWSGHCGEEKNLALPGTEPWPSSCPNCDPVTVIKENTVTVLSLQIMRIWTFMQQFISAHINTQICMYKYVYVCVCVCVCACVCVYIYTHACTGCS